MFKQVSVVMVTYNNARTIEAVLDGLAEQGNEILSEVVVVDNGSRDGTADIVRGLSNSYAWPLVLVQSANVGFAAGILAGTQHFSGASLPTLCLNPDLVLAPGTLNGMLDALNKVENAGIVTAPLVTSDGVADSASVRKLPKLGTAAVYAALGKFTPTSLRYNGHSAKFVGEHNSAAPVEATTGALMLVHPQFRNPSHGIFDTDYWMYGEDLQLCRDAAEEGWVVLMTATAPSLHIKGVSSGWPRSLKSNIAFHRAMYQYYQKNLAKTPLLTVAVYLAVNARLMVSVGLGAGAKLSTVMGQAIKVRKSASRTQK